MIDAKSLEIYMKKGLPLTPGENCSLYNSAEALTGICGLDDSSVGLEAGCRKPELCYKLQSRNIQVERLN